MKGCKERRKDWRGWDLLIKWLEVRLCEMQTVADVILISWLPFHIDSPTFVHLSQFRFNTSFSKFRWLIPLCIWFSSISMILQHQDINLVPFIMLPGNRSELNLVRWKDINKNKKNQNHYLPLLMQNLCVGLLVFSDWGISKTLNDIPVTRCCL